MIKNSTKSKIPSIEQMESQFLSVAPTDGFRVTKNFEQPSNLNAIISKDMAQADIAFVARLLIQAYGGWPFYPQILRRRILTTLSRIYNSISGPIKIFDLYELLKPIIKMMPDRHIMIVADKNPALNRSPAIDIGDNLVKSRNIPEPYLIEKQGNVGIIALSRFFEPDDKAHLEKIRQRVLDIMSGTDAIIIDLRNNGGGDSRIAAMLGDTLSGFNGLPRSRRMFARNTKLARELQSYIDMPALKKVSGKTDPFMIVDNSKFKMPKNHKWAFDGDIYVLVNNRSASSSELVINCMKYNPRTKIVGTNSSGCDQYVNYRYIILPGSGISIRLPLAYREVPHVKPRGFEMHGFTPDIKCDSGTDAFAVAMDMINSQNIEKSVIKNSCLKSSKVIEK